ncbi:MAG: YesL family protein [Lachnospiraceae bacterium]
MKNLFDPDNMLFQTLSRLADLVMLNIIFLICCIPVITIGASITAMYKVTLQMAYKEDGYIIRDFLKSFKKNFIQATIIWMIVLFFGVLLFFNFKIILQVKTAIFTVILVLTGTITFLYAITVIYVFPLLARFNNTIFKTIRNAFFMSIANFLPYSLLMLAFPIVLFSLSCINADIFWWAIFVCILFGFSGIALINSYLFKRIFKKYHLSPNTETI